MGGEPFAATTVGIGDFNGDGISDLVIAEGGGPIVEVFFGNGDGTFKVGPTTPAGLNPTGIAVADFNGDGKPDLAVTEPVASGNTNVVILLGNGDGTFTATPSLAGVESVSSGIVAADFNGDGKADLAVESAGALGWVNIYLGNGDGTFTQAPQSPIQGTAPHGSFVAAGDFNGDGIADLVTSSSSNADSLSPVQGNDTLSVLLGKGDGTFQPAVHVVAASLNAFAISSVALGDFNGSGLSGITSAGDAGNNAYVLLPQAPQQTATATATLTGVSIIGSGNHNIIAVYSGDSIYQPSTSPPLPLAAQQQPTTVTLTVSPTTSNYGQPVLMTATLMPITAEGHNATGAITFVVASKTLGTAAFVNGVATFTSSLLPVGTDTVAAIYSGDANFASSGGSATEVVTGFPSASVLTASPNPSFVGQTVTITATVTGVGSTVIASGDVTFYDNLTVIGQGTLDATGHATMKTSVLALGVHELSFVYLGDLGYYGSASPQVMQLVTAQGSTTTLTVAPNPAGAGQPVTLTAAVTLSNSGAAPGTITFYDGATQINQTTLDPTGHATYTTSSLALGTHSLTAVYPGSPGYTGSTSPAVSELIETLDFNMTLSSPSITLPTYQHTTTTVTLTSLGAFADNISITCGNPPVYVTCIFKPTPAALTSNGTTAVSFYLDTDSILGGSVNGPIHGSLAPPPTSTRLALLLSPFTLLTLLATRRRARRPTLFLLAVILTLPTALLFTACGSSVIIPIPSAAPGTFTIPITATGATTGIAHTTNLTLQITP
jgi:dolichol kinase